MARLVLFGKVEVVKGNSETERLPNEEWEKYRRIALRYLKAADGAPGTIAMLEEVPFSWEVIWHESNFGEMNRTEMELLLLRVPVEVFVEIEREVGHWNQRIAQGIPEMVHALNMVGCNIVGVGAQIELDAENNPVELLGPEDLKVTSGDVEHALAQARTLLLSHGAPAALDRVHTVFHGYLKAACDKANITIPDSNPGIVQLLGVLKAQRAFSADSELEALVTQTLRGGQRIVDALETFRDEHSLAHPQPMLPEPEALLVINITQAILRYLDSRLETA
jgi:hypothetical protein